VSKTFLLFKRIIRLIASVLLFHLTPSDYERMDFSPFFQCSSQKVWTRGLMCDQARAASATSFRLICYYFQGFEFALLLTPISVPSLSIFCLAIKV
jgi:hypothetical protein